MTGPVSDASRAPLRRRLWPAGAVAIALCLGGGAALAQEGDPNLPAVKAVCGRCHGETQFMDKPRSWERWNDVFRKMTELGATGSDDQLEQVTSYFLEHLTTLNVNTDPEVNVAWVLDVSEEVAQTIVAERQKKPFTSLAQLEAVPGVSRDRVERLKSRITF